MSDDVLRATVATATHDLSNAIGAVVNYTTFLTEDLTRSGAAPEYLPHLQSAAERALALVAGLAAALARDAERD
ncbi:hypothetical protein Dvina_52900 [Dactylosporangium vinaceum]|uniref:histidine kinase n=1 Tax=Dactylosporangium vinaceum TaxID=53362 RepID=A0ABV5MQB4_9ACTN|nr:hypothetical protein [Dactylosporangium vinaceum]UAB96516.1 hypothetical protein Dvina_52900 [Dactylosporangium vinaceum]